MSTSRYDGMALSYWEQQRHHLFVERDRFKDALEEIDLVTRRYVCGAEEGPESLGVIASIARKALGSAKTAEAARS